METLNRYIGGGNRENGVASKRLTYRFADVEGLNR